VRAHMLKCLAVGLLVLAIGTLNTETAYAQQEQGDRVEGNIAGTFGLGLLGAEVGLFVPPALNLQDRWWAWVLFPAIGAAGGAVAGAFAFDPGSPDPAVTVSLLGVGMLLAVPAVVGASALSSARRANKIDEAQGGGLLRFSKRGASVGAPSITTQAVFSPTEQTRYSLPQKSSTRVALISGRF
jgi:peptidoglycan/LPS O-acetylase OafA/YrhL